MGEFLLLLDPVQLRATVVSSTPFRAITDDIALNYDFHPLKNTPSLFFVMSFVEFHGYQFSLLLMLTLRWMHLTVFYLPQLIKLPL